MKYYTRKKLTYEYINSINTLWGGNKMSRFYCRDEELRKLNKRYENGKFECVVIYGRRRVGKTALINEFCKDKPTIFFSALNTTGKENLEALSKAIMSFERPNAESSPEFTTYDAALDELTALSKEQRIVFVIDEYPYLAKAKPAISAMLQHIIDHKWTESQMYLILCGSSMSFMESQVLGKESPLYGRRTAQFKIMPLDYRETAVFHPNLSEEDNALIYGITGGVPHYINKLVTPLRIGLMPSLVSTCAYRSLISRVDMVSPDDYFSSNTCAIASLSPRARRLSMTFIRCSEIAGMPISSTSSPKKPRTTSLWASFSEMPRDSR